MNTFTVEEIEQDAMKTRSVLEVANKTATKQIALLKTVTVKGLLSYTERVLFLVDEIKKLRTGPFIKPALIKVKRPGLV